jgi:hypothetical protein
MKVKIIILKNDEKDKINDEYSNITNYKNISIKIVSKVYAVNLIIRNK